MGCIRPCQKRPRKCRARKEGRPISSRAAAWPFRESTRYTSRSPIPRRGPPRATRTPFQWDNSCTATRSSRFHIPSMKLGRPHKTWICIAKRGESLRVCSGPPPTCAACSGPTSTLRCLARLQKYLSHSQKVSERNYCHSLATKVLSFLVHFRKTTNSSK